MKPNIKRHLIIPALLATSLLTACGAQLESEDGRLKVFSEKLLVDTTDVDTTTQINGFSNKTNDGQNKIETNSIICSLLCFTPSLTLVGTIAPPVVNGLSLQASDVTVHGSKAYVAYNSAGALEAGGVDVIDLSGKAPSLKSSTTFTDSDINSVLVSGSKLYLTGNTSSGDTGAVIYRYSLNSLDLPTTTRETKFLRSSSDATVPAYSGTQIIKSGNYIYATSGNNGGLSVLSASTLAEVAFAPIPDARAVAIGNSHNILVASGKTSTSSAQVRSLDISTLTQQNSPVATTFPSAVIDEGKSTIYTHTSAYLASSGQGGVKLICDDGTSVGSMPIPVVAGLSSADVAANAVTFGRGIIYVAQGGAGVYMYSVQKSLLGSGGCAGLTISYAGKFTLGARGSANNVYYDHGNLIVATGHGGFQIIEVTQGLIAGLLQVL